MKPLCIRALPLLALLVLVTPAFGDGPVTLSPHDGTFETAYGAGDDVSQIAFAQSFTIPAGWTAQAAHLCFTHQGGGGDLPFDLIVLDDGGPGGGPGSTLLQLDFQLAQNVPAIPGTRVVDVDLGGLALPEGTIWVGANWFPQRDPDFFLCADTDVTEGSAMGSVDGGAWEATPTPVALGIDLVVDVPPGTDPCVPDATTLCLQDGRFEVTVDWRDQKDNTGVGSKVTESDDSALFYFFQPDNWELLVKVLDGCGVNDHYWVFSAATTNVEYTLRVTDTETGAGWEHSNPLGTAAASLNDTRAFATCP